MKFNSKSNGRVQELTIIIITLGIVFFVLYAVYKNVSKLGSIRSIRGNNEGFLGNGSGSLEYSSYPGNQALDSKEAYKIETNDKTHTESKVQGSEDHCGRVWGLNGLFCSPGVSDSLIDVFYSAKTDMKCQGSGYSKGSGNLCLDKTQNKLLTSRGGNADSKDYYKS
jgi:hypothetical protein